MIDSVRDLGHALQGRRLPLRPDGPPHEAEHARRSGRRSTRSRPAHDGVDGTTIYLYGEGWNFGEVAEQRARRQRHAAQHGRHRHRHLQRPAARRRRAAAARSAACRSRASSPASSYDPNAHEPGLAGRPARRGSCSDMDWIRVGLAGNLADYRARRPRSAISSRRGRSTTTASRPATPPTRRRSSTTSRRTTTRRCSTRSS